MSDHTPTFDSRAALSLALFGYIPFVALTIALFMPPLGGYSAITQLALQAYAAVILSFLGGIRWGIALREDTPSPAAATFAFSVVPSLWGWAAFLVPSTMLSLLMFATGFALMGWWDWSLVSKGGAPTWFGRLRIILTLLVAPTLLIAAFA